MFSVTVRDHMMIAHSFRGEVFGPAQRLHGATYVVDATFRARELDADGIVVDIGRAADALRAVVGELNYRNLDDEPRLRRPEHHHRGARAARSPTGWPAHLADAGLAGILVTLRESHVAWAGYGAAAVSEVHFIVPEGLDDPARPSGWQRLLPAGLRRLAARGWAVREQAVADAAALARAPRLVPDGAVVLLDHWWPFASPAPRALVPEADRLRQVVLCTCHWAMPASARCSRRRPPSGD